LKIPPPHFLAPNGLNMKLTALFASAVSLCFGSFLQAGDPAISDPAQVDAAYHFLGEYVGKWSGRPIAVQVSTRKGDAQFYAKVFQGGLPGIGWDGTPPQLFGGNEAGSQLRLVANAGSAQMEVTPNKVTVADGDSRAELRKVARHGVTLGKTPPAGAKILFDGTSTSAFKSASMTSDGLLKAGAETVDPIGSCRLHLEFRTPYMPHSEDQKRGNSGIYIQRRYEVQILESFGQDCVFNGCGALYRQREPNLNMSLPPLIWQTYDIFFIAARFDHQGNKLAPAQISVIHNGVPVHYRTVVASKTGAGKPEGPEPLPLMLQDHSDPIVFRNVWLQAANSGTLTYNSDPPQAAEQVLNFPGQAGQRVTLVGEYLPR
jgi:hypothetical protein